MGREFFDLPVDQQQESLTSFADEMLKEFAITNAKVDCINYEFNATFSVVTESGQKFALRININSTRSLENIKAEIQWVLYLNRVSDIHVPTPIAAISDQYVVSMIHEPSGERLFGVLYSWLEGEEMGDSPSTSQLHEVGKAIATMHQSSRNFELTNDVNLPTFNDFFWGTQDYLFSEKSLLNSKDKALIQDAHDLIMQFTQELYASSAVQIIHADFHGWNLMWNEEQLSIFDFDDCGFGVEAQDLAIALYYLDTPDQDAALLAGYKSVRDLPIYSHDAMAALQLQRRLLLLNYLYETKNPDHKEMLPAYLAKSLERVSAFLTDVRG